MTYDTGCAIVAFPESDLSPEVQESLSRSKNGRNYKTASSEMISDQGGLQVKAVDEYGQLRRLKGRAAGVHRTLVVAFVAAQAGQSGWIS